MGLHKIGLPMLLFISFCLLDFTLAQEDERFYGCICPRILGPVCGSNGKDYANDCLLECDQKDEPYLRIAYQGYCDGNDNENWL
ncbi:unnamed protein product [Orchesella dallaii]|uniref:Kazal-like domain-containing protein n=1 Tax=Orchesella dallaii TaxID=48710 RepID=A0ABP1Q7J4_9HEXA